jgi:hypothetical protein
LADSVTRSGKCQCGEVRYEVSGDPLRVGLCHCTDCRQSSGSAFTLFAVWPRRQFRTASHFATYRGRSFCPHCGSRVFSLRPDEAEIMVGSLDDAPSKLIPTYEIWTPRRESWLHGLPWTDQYEGDRTAETGTWRESHKEGTLP